MAVVKAPNLRMLANDLSLHWRCVEDGQEKDGQGKGSEGGGGGGGGEAPLPPAWVPCGPDGFLYGKVCTLCLPSTVCPQLIRRIPVREAGHADQGECARGVQAGTAGHAQSQTVRRLLGLHHG